MSDLKNKVAVIIGRFQTPHLTNGHKALFHYATVNCKRTIVFLGVSSLKNTKLYPLDYETRRLMIKEAHPTIEVYPIHDHKSDITWSENVDALIQNILGMREFCVLLGGRDSFIPRYHGRNATLGISEATSQSGTELRDIAAQTPLSTANFRCGVIYASQNRWPQVHPTVDIAIYDRKNDKYLMARKNVDGGLWRFVGGFVDPTDPTLEAAARREVAEETGVEIGALEYMSSFIVPDYRYAREDDKIMTTLFHADYVFGVPTAKDDIDEVRWFSLSNMNGKNIVPEHLTALAALALYNTNKEK